METNLPTIHKYTISRSTPDRITGLKQTASGMVVQWFALLPIIRRSLVCQGCGDDPIAAHATAVQHNHFIGTGLNKGFIFSSLQLQRVDCSHTYPPRCVWDHLTLWTWFCAQRVPPWWRLLLQGWIPASIVGTDGFKTTNYSRSQSHICSV